jgi:hydroxypyruvate isomerase
MMAGDGNARMKLAACIEWMFTEYQDYGSRIRAARAAGLTEVEMHLWRPEKPLDAIEAALDETGVRLISFCVEPRKSLVDPREESQVLAAVRAAIPVAQRFRGAAMIVASGFTRADEPIALQQAQAVRVLKAAAAMAEQTGTMLLLEPVNMTLNGAAMFVDSIARGLDIVEAVDSPGLRLLCDVYHSAVTGEHLGTALGTRMQWVGHVQVADTDGRHEPGTGGLDWNQVMSTLREKGYSSSIGLEYLPSLPTVESLALTRRTLGLA